MSALAEKIVNNKATYECSREALEVAEELERRRALATKDPSRLRDGDAHLQNLLKSRQRHV